MRAAATVLVAVLLAGCADERERYCEAVADRQAELSEQVAGGDPAALIGSLPTLRALAEEAPSDIRDEWSVVVDRVAALEAALEQAGVDPTTYDAEDPPGDLAVADRDRIEQAALDLGSERTQRALADLEQQARDVCGTPLVI